MMVLDDGKQMKKRKKNEANKRRKSNIPDYLGHWERRYYHTYFLFIVISLSYSSFNARFMASGLYATVDDEGEGQRAKREGKEGDRMNLD